MPRLSTETRIPLRIAINAQFLPGQGAGGVESVLMALVHALGQLQDGTEEYTVIGPAQDTEWLRPYLGSNERVVPGPMPPPSSTGIPLGPIRPLARKMKDLVLGSSPAKGVFPQVLPSNGFYESLGCQVIHFPYQFAFQDYIICALPTIFNPHDLQHLHYPEFFAPSIIRSREIVYPAACHFAQTVVVGSHWVRQDIVSQYGVSPTKIQVIPWAPPTHAYPEPLPDMLVAVSEKYHLQTPFAMYPAMTWQHKNHIRLLQALALLRDRDGLKVNLVCTGYQNDFWPRIEENLKALNLVEQVRFLGMVPTPDLRALYRLSQFVVIPTLFEAASAPLFEAWLEGVPAACSTVTSLPEQAGNAALLFDPLSVDAIANAVAMLAADPALRDRLKALGAARLKDFSWERTAKAYRAVYRRAARHSLTEEDRWLLSSDWMRQPQVSGRTEM